MYNFYKLMSINFTADINFVTTCTPFTELGNIKCKFCQVKRCFITSEKAKTCRVIPRRH